MRKQLLPQLAHRSRLLRVRVKFLLYNVIGIVGVGVDVVIGVGDSISDGVRLGASRVSGAGVIGHRDGRDGTTIGRVASDHSRYRCRPTTAS